MVLASQALSPEEWMILAKIAGLLGIAGLLVQGVRVALRKVHVVKALAQLAILPAVCIGLTLGILFYPAVSLVAGVFDIIGVLAPLAEGVAGLIEWARDF